MSFKLSLFLQIYQKKCFFETNSNLFCAHPVFSLSYSLRYLKKLLCKKYKTKNRIKNLSNVKKYLKPNDIQWWTDLEKCCIGWTTIFLPTQTYENRYFVDNTLFSYKPTVLYDPSKSETYKAIQEAGYDLADYTEEVTVPVQPKVFQPHKTVPGKVRSQCRIVIEATLSLSTAKQVSKVTSSCV